MFFNRKPGFKLFYASDLHGSERCFLKFVNAAKFYGVQALILGGDLTGKGVVPIVATGVTWRARFLSKDYDVDTEAEVTELEKVIRFNGFYPYRTTPDEVNRMDNDAEYTKDVFDRLMAESVERWVGIAEERLADSGVGLYAIGGNDDEWFVDNIFQASSFVRYNENNVVEIGPCRMVGCSYANPTPWNSPREMNEATLLKHLEQLVKDSVADGPMIYNFHVPPYGSGLDLAPELTDDLRVVTTGGQPNMIPVGSKAVRQVIEEHQPILTLHGHIHESRAASKIGKTIAINPGSRYGEGVLDGALVTLTDSGVKAYQLVAG